MSGIPGNGELERELAERGAVAGLGQPRDERLEVVEERRCRVQRAAEALDGLLPLRVLSTQFVLRFASRSAFSMYPVIRSRSIGHAPASVWKMK